MNIRSMSMIAPAVLMLAGIALTAKGLSGLSPAEAFSWSSSEAFIGYVSFVLLSALAVSIGAWRSKLSPFAAAVAIAIAISIFAGAFWPLLVIVLFGFTCAIVGESVLALFRYPSSENRPVFSLLVGAGIFGTAVGTLAHFPINTPALYGAMLFGPLFFGWRRGVALADRVKLQLSAPRLPGHGIDIAISTIGLVYFVAAFFPELGADALVTHLYLPAQLAQRQQWGFDPMLYAWAVMPMLGDWLFSFGYMLAGETAARLINTGFIFVVCWLTKELVLWAGGSRLGARVAVLLLLSTPLAFTESSSLFIESVWAAFLLAGTLSTLAACADPQHRKSLLLAGLFLASALATKVITLMMIPALMLVLGWHYKIWFKTNIAVTVGALLLFVIFGCSPYVTAWWLTGNPVFPFFNQLFQSAYFPLENMDNPLFRTKVSWNTLYQVTFDSGRYIEAPPGIAGFQWLLLFIPAAAATIFLRHRRACLLLFIALVSICFTFLNQSYLRYIFPEIAILTVVIALGWDAFANLRWLKRLATVTAGIVVVLNLYFFGSNIFYKDFPLETLISKQSRQLYLEQHAPMRNIVETVNQANPDNSPVAIFGAPKAIGLTADVLLPIWYNWKFQNLVEGATTEAALGSALVSNNVNILIVDLYWGTPARQSMLQKISTELIRHGTISVRRLNDEYRFGTELLKSPDFSTADGWGFMDGAYLDSNSNITTVKTSASASQLVAVRPNKLYRDMLVARCKNGQGRLQINWLDKELTFINTAIQVFDCTDSWTEHSMQAVSPAGAVNAVYYLTTHSAEAVEFKRASLR